MTPKGSDELKGARSALANCNTFGDALLTLIRKRQLKDGMKLENILSEIPITLRNWRRLTSEEIVPSISTYNGLVRELCEADDVDIFEAMYIRATQEKKRFGSGDIAGLIRIGSGIDCTPKDTIDPKCFRSVAFSRNARSDGALGGVGALEFYRSLRSLLTSGRLPARSDLDRKLRTTIIIYREAWVARTMSRLDLHERLVGEIEALGVESLSAFIKGSLIDQRLLATNAPDELMFPDIDKPVIDSHVRGFQEVIELYRIFDKAVKDPLKEYGFESAEDDARINMLRLACQYGADEAGAALKELRTIQRSDEERGAPRFITIYNDFVEAEALISLNRRGEAREKCLGLLSEAKQIERTDLVGEAMMLHAKSLTSQTTKAREFDAGLSVIREAVAYFASLGNDVKVGALQTVLRRAEGVRHARFG